MIATVTMWVLVCQDDFSDHLQALVRQHMKVIEEKRELEDALFRMRKKLLSISNSAAAAAGEPCSRPVQDSL